MAENPCLEFFESHLNDGEKVKALVKDGRGDEWLAAGLCASAFSPGVVTSDEVIVRQVHSPLHWDPETQVVKPGFYDDLTNKGLSVNRVDHVEELDALTEESEARARSSNREAIGFVKFPASAAQEISKMVDGGSVGVFDTALQNDRSHADVCQTTGATRAHGRELRQKMFQALKECFHRGPLKK
ncbi:hypothetical protein [Stenotrophomonas maltophilia]|uniref:hypothetical protein n=1 Tax=Stenotrophomonas maltophilia TaxID=40324 RepID=UPI001954F0AF|nr:hypothetical protein [Stenotrophomonas maltophilia]